MLHAGRLGVEKGIVFEACKVLQKQYGSHFQNLFAYVGPSIRKCLLNRDDKTYFYIARYLINSNNNKVLSDTIIQLNKKSTLNITTTRSILLMLYIKAFFSVKLKKFKKSCQKRARTIKEWFNLPSK